MRQSETINKLLEALAKAQSEFVTLPKDKSGYGYKYTDLDTVISTVRPILAKYGMGFMQTLTILESGRNGLTTRIFSSTGEYIEDTVILPEITVGGKTNTAQNLGAAITYMKRYSLCAMLGISSDEDTDAVVQTPQQSYQQNYNRVQNNQTKPAPQKAPAKQNTQQITPQQVLTFKGGPATEAEQKRITELTKAQYANGQQIFSRDEIISYSKMRQTEKTAAELIAFIENALRNRRADAPELKTAGSLC